MSTSNIPEDLLSFLAPKLNDDEKEWASLEPAWADFLHATRTGHRARLDRASLRGQSFGQVHQKLEVHRLHFEKGEQYHLFVALCTCARERVPMPYWVADALLVLSDSLHSKSISLHRLFGAHKHFPETPAKRAKNKKRQQLETDLYIEMSKLIYADKKSRNDALNTVLALPRFRGKIGKTTAIKIYCHRDALQQEFIRAGRVDNSTKSSRATGTQPTPLELEAAQFAIKKMRKPGKRTLTRAQAVSLALAVTRFRVAITPGRLTEVITEVLKQNER